MSSRRLISRSLLGLASLALVACGSSNTGGGDGDGGAVPDCPGGIDLDEDGYGELCPAGEDCNDFDPTVQLVCPDANCGLGPAQGCACDPADEAPVACYDGPPGTETSGQCGKGTRICDPATETWSECDGQVLPEVERCDEVDNDCNGATDEGVQSACGNCIPGCDGTGVDDDPFPLPPEEGVGADGVGLDENGDLVLDESTYENHFIWVANDPEGTVTKIDTRTGCEVARYATVSHDVGVLIDHTGGSPVRAWNAGNNPSRTAVDYRGDMWVANRAFGGQPSLTKILNVIEDCEDRNGDMMINTSMDVSGNCQIEVGNPAEFFAEQDECIAMTVVVGANNTYARAIAIDAGIDPGDPGDPWVGMWGEGAFYEIDGRTGALEQRVPATGSLGISPYGAAIDSTGRLWAVDHAGSPTLVEINTLINPATYVAPVGIPTAPGSYGLVVDTEDRVWVAGYGGPTVSRYDPATGMGVTVDPFGGGYSSRGLGIDSHGNVWAAAHNPGRVARIDADSVTVTGNWDIGGTTPVGVGVDFDGDVWSVNQGTSTASRLHIDQTTLEPAPHPTTSNTVDTFPTGPNPYTYSDFTGLGLRLVTNPLGEWRTIIQGCVEPDLATWLGVTWDATTPPSTSVEIWVRVGDDYDTISSEPIYGPWLMSPADLTQPPGPVPDAKFLQLIIVLKSADGEATPIVHGYEVQWACPGEPIP